MSNLIKEGWVVDREIGTPESHYIRNKSSLCNSIAYSGNIYDYDNEFKGKAENDCDNCWSALKKNPPNSIN